MTKYIMPIIKDKERREQEKDTRIPLHKAPPPPPLGQDRPEKDNDIDKTIVDFDIDGNIVEISIRV